ncbi:Glutamate-1-semialdehyde aminotransferase [Hahella chejuensis KCTC 2396]|uniref:Glutamate-1-semialdehyde aminotransferase n=1 Tax=Hahella chejuensis (strain KCTC 2396) TaxID=349521 RepID=Q2S819_HAHCH|nr:aminotransferase class III-fold pyridoxal phosphate-dependent enzyme [Hahella chejuensis]ABC33205.1 Glutamate-1-semialdehyde aminotransferase [Hahella chejuensis KCTC 2396]
MTLPVTSNGESLNLTKSFELAKESEKLVAGFTQSMMKKPEQFAPGQFPIYIQSGQGAIVTDVDGNEYIDFICGLAANTLGHNHPTVVSAISENLSNGLIHSLPTPVEVKAAQTLTDIIPGAEMARFFKTGADANSAAVRLARHITGKEEIITVGYNGWHDQYMFDTPGVPEVIRQYTHRMPLFTPMDEQPVLDLIAERGDKLAAVLLSVPYNRVLTGEFLRQVRKACNDKGVLLVMDEVVTGFRLALGGAQEYFDVSADLVTLSKGIAAGMPLSAVVGSAKHMKRMEELQVSTTFGGEMLSLEVCDAVLNEYRRSDFVGRIATLGVRLKEGVNKVSAAQGTPLQVVGYDPIPMFLFSKNPVEHVKLAEPFLAEMAKRGVLLRREVNFICGVHTEEQIDFTINAVEASLQAMLGAGLFVKAEDGAAAQ